MPRPCLPQDSDPSPVYLFSRKVLNTHHHVEGSSLGTGGWCPAPHPGGGSRRGRSGEENGWGKRLEVSVMTGTDQRDGEAGGVSGGGRRGGQQGPGRLCRCLTHGHLWTVKGRISKTHKRPLEILFQACFSRPCLPLGFTPSSHKICASSFSMTCGPPSTQQSTEQTRRRRRCAEVRYSSK